jgi:hypothetical protein
VRANLQHGRIAFGGLDNAIRVHAFLFVGSVETKAATVVLIPHNDGARAQRRLERDVIPSLQSYSDWKFELLVVDNSGGRLNDLARFVESLPWPSRYVWHNGVNLQYGPAMNVAARLAAHPVLVYLCANHGRMVDPGWVEDLVSPFWQNERVALTGHHYPSGAPSMFGFPSTIGAYHIQGGVLGLRTAVIRRFPYHEGEYAHGCSDIWQSYRLMQAGFALHDVPSVMSVWRTHAPAGRYKYVHDDTD